MNLSQPYYIEPRAGKLHIDLNGQWDFGDMPEQTGPESVRYTMKANVPGSVYRHLFEAGIEADPYKGVNSHSYSWVDDRVWYYHRSFPGAELTSDQQAILCLDGSCYYTRVWLNGTLLGEHEGMFGGPVVDITGHLHRDNNDIVIEVRACNWKWPEFSPWNPDKEHPFPIIPWYLMRDRNSHDGDFNVIGLWRGVRIEILENTHLSRPYLYTESATERKAVLRFEVEITDPDVPELGVPISTSRSGMDFTNSFGTGNAGIRQNRSLEIHLELKERGSETPVFSVSEAYAPYDWTKSFSSPAYFESHHYQRVIEIDNPALWNPAFLGKPNLYDVTVSLLEKGQILDTLSFASGIRTIRRKYSAGAKMRSRWDRFWFVINGKPVFMRGVNWMPIDQLLVLREKDYRWTLELARNMGVMMIRVWSGGGIPENDTFYRLCDELGLLVWQDNMIANMETPNIDHDILLNQVCMNLYRIRNHASLAIHCGGNEFNPYALGNQASVNVIQSCCEDLDPSRDFLRTTPDRGSAHIYQDIEPGWYRILCQQIPFVAESGIHSFPSYPALRNEVCQSEMLAPLDDLFSAEFEKTHPELRNHFAEFHPDRVPRMLARASAITSMEKIRIKDLIEATQIAAYEFYQIMAEAMRENYPVTTGLMPWVFRRPSVAVGIQLVDGGGFPLPPYYAVQNAYAPLSVSLRMPHLTFKPGEEIELNACVLNDENMSLKGLRVKLEILNPDMETFRCDEQVIAADSTQSVLSLCFGKMILPESWSDHFFFICLTLSSDRKRVNRKFYWPRCLSLLSDPEVFAQRRNQPAPNLFIKNGPYLKDQITKCSGARLRIDEQNTAVAGNRETIDLRISNRGTRPAFPVTVTGTRLPAMCTENYFVLFPNETCRIQVSFMLEDPELPECIQLSSWNGETVSE